MTTSCFPRRWPKNWAWRSPTYRADLDLFLGARHYEILGLTPELTVRLAAAILADASRRIGRVPKDDLEPLGAEICRRDPEFQKHLKGDWATRLAPLLDDSTLGG